MKSALVLLAAVLLLAGCGGPKDPFVGTWRPVMNSDDGERLVIAKTHSGYLMTDYEKHDAFYQLRLTRRGDTLKGKLVLWVPSGPPVGTDSVVARFDSATKHISCELGTDPAESYSKLTTATALPHPLRLLPPGESSS